VTTLTTERLILRPVARDDLPDVLALAGDAAVAETTGSIPHPLSGTDVEAWWTASSGDNPRVFAIVRAADKAFLGAITLTFSEDRTRAELGYWIGHPYWGQGYATEAVRRLLRFAFGELKLGSVEAEVFTGNDASMRVLAKTGFREVGSATRHAPVRGGDREVVLFTATRASFAQAALSQAVGRT
jgi:RimJ/RimL family protein N-acetyltransferase